MPISQNFNQVVKFDHITQVVCKVTFENLSEISWKPTNGVLTSFLSPQQKTEDNQLIKTKGWFWLTVLVDPVRNLLTL